MGEEKFRRLPFLSLPPGGKVAPKGPDEGAGFGLHLLYAGEFRRLRAASFFPSDGKETKGSPGDGSGWTLRVHIRLPYPLCRFATAPPDRGSRPPDPRYGGYPLKWAEHFRRAKSGVLGCGFVRATGPWAGGKLGLMRFRFCAWVCRTNAPRPILAVGAAFGRPRAGLGPAPTKRTERSPYFVGAAHWAARGTGVKASGPAQRQTPFRGLRRGGARTRPPSH